MRAGRWNSPGVGESGLRERLEGYGARRRRPDWEGEEDDWLAPAGELEWLEPPPAAPGRARKPRTQPRAAPEQPRPPVAVVQRRRAVAFLVLLALAAAGIALAVVLVRGGGGGEATTSAPEAAPATTTAPQATTPTAPPKPAAPAFSLPAGVTKLSEGDTGDAVKALQRALAKLGYDPGPADGDFGPRTTAAVGEFQQAQGLARDGVVGEKTVAKLNAALAP